LQIPRLAFFEQKVKNQKSKVKIAIQK